MVSRFDPNNSNLSFFAFYFSRFRHISVNENLLLDAKR